MLWYFFKLIKLLITQRADLHDSYIIEFYLDILVCKFSLFHCEFFQYE